jgi:DNA polymerase eta
MRIAAMFREELPGCEVGTFVVSGCSHPINSTTIEKASIDEAFIDFTKPVREIILQRYPHLAQVPADAPDGIDTPVPMPPQVSWEGLGDLIPINPPLSEEKDNIEEVDESGSDNIEAPLAKEGPREFMEPPLTWHDVALSIGAKLMGSAREQVRVKLGYSTSAVGDSPLFARSAAYSNLGHRKK